MPLTVGRVAPPIVSLVVCARNLACWSDISARPRRRTTTVNQRRVRHRLIDDASSSIVRTYDNAERRQLASWRETDDRRARDNHTYWRRRMMLLLC